MMSCLDLPLRRLGMARDHKVLPVTHSPHVYPQAERSMPASILTDCRALLISRLSAARRLSWPRWLGEILRWFARPKAATRPSISRGGRESNSRQVSRLSL